jgi:CubicO group peptidase (beta-lactamase class C family)
MAKSINNLINDQMISLMNKLKEMLIAAPITYLFLLTASQAQTINWEIKQPGSQSVNAKIIEELHEEFKDGQHGYIDSFLIIRNNQLIYERYYKNNYDDLTKNRRLEQNIIMQENYGDNTRDIYNYYDPEWHPYYKNTDLHTIQSVSKSVTSALIGIAIDRNEIPSINTKISSYFPEYSDYFNDPLKQSITIHDLLTMTAGIKWDESSFLYTDPLNNAATMENSQNWLSYILSLPMSDVPGKKFVYNSGITILLSHILYEATGMHVDAYAKKYLFNPLGIENFYWKKTPLGLTDTEGGLYLSTRDFAKIGHLYLNEGQVNNLQLLKKKWVEDTMAPDTNISDSSRKYGYQWWLVPYENNDEKFILSGSGYGGQYLLIIPEFELIVVFNGWNIFDKDRPSIEYLSQRVLKAIQ